MKIFNFLILSVLADEFRGSRPDDDQKIIALQRGIRGNSDHEPVFDPDSSIDDPAEPCENTTALPAVVPTPATKMISTQCQVECGDDCIPICDEFDEDCKYYTGPRGDKGIDGQQGCAGENGHRGPCGDAGPDGQPGQTGPPGEPGRPGHGKFGACGPKGSSGQKGIAGRKGYSGSRGNPGYPGGVGQRGTTGSQGAGGAKGITGNQGKIGFQGMLIKVLS